MRRLVAERVPGRRAEPPALEPRPSAADRNVQWWRALVRIEHRLGGGNAEGA
jgi:hypothetical protein